MLVKIFFKVERGIPESFSNMNSSLMTVRNTVTNLEKEMEEFQKEIHDFRKGFSATRKDVQHLKEVILPFFTV